ncbi:hypothetical protein B0H11DRAFT_1937689 [Mycena galericulata]|nr:hypothetical protein B0H11DRAFT_1937689 [Mycena galericulata]
MSASNDNPENVDVTSPHKTARASVSDDTTTHLPDFRSDRERPSPGINRKVSGSGSAHRTPTLDASTNVFLASPRAQGSHGNLPLFGALRQTPTNPSSRRRGHPARSQSESPTPSHRQHEGLDTGHHATDVSDLEDGEIAQDAVQALTQDAQPGDEDFQMDEAAAAVHPADDTMVDADAADAADGADDESDGLAAMSIDNAEAAPAFEVGQAPGMPAPALVHAAPVQGVARPPEPPVPQGPGAHQFFFAHPANANDALGIVLNAPAPAAAANPNPLANVQPNAAGPMFVFGNAGQGANPVVAAVQNAGPAAAAAAVAQFGFPDLMTQAAAEPTDRALNPHRKLPAAQPLGPTGPADLGRLTEVQPSVGNFDTFVISETAIQENVSDESLAPFKDKPEEHLYGVPFNAGRYAFARLPNLVDVATNALSAVVGPNEVTVFTVAAKDPNYGNSGPPGTGSRYPGPIMFGIHVPNPVARAALAAYQTFAVDKTFAFQVISPEDLKIPWVAGIYGPSIGGGSAAGKLHLRAALTKHIRTDANVGQMLDQTTWAADRSSLDERRHKLSLSVDPIFDPIMEKFVVFIKPCTTNAAGWKALTKAICPEQLVSGYYIYKSMDPPRPSFGPRCVVCKNDTHFASGCSFTHDPQWWGPPGQISELTEGPLAPANNGGGGRARGRGRGRGGQDGGQGGGRGGWNNGGGGRGARGRGGRGRGGY